MVVLLCFPPMNLNLLFMLYSVCFLIDAALDKKQYYY
jgi:hypothetical protein